MKAKPFQPGQILGGYEVLALKHLGANTDETIYDCRTVCCGKEAVRSHVILYDAKKRGQKACKPCADKMYQERRKANSRRQVGEVLGYMEVIGYVGDDYRIRTTCCGREEIKKHAQVSQCAWQDMACCIQCRRAGYVRKEEEEVPVIQDTRQVWCLETQGIISAALAWPRPRSLAAC